MKFLKQNTSVLQRTFQKVLEPAPGVVRFVINADLDLMQQFIDQAPFDEEKGYNWAESKVLASQVRQVMYPFVGFDQPFNLVTSLCDDGWHRPVFDLDFEPDQLEFNENGEFAWLKRNGGRSALSFKHGDGPINAAAYNSTNHLHVYTDEPMLFTEYMELLAGVPGEDARKYHANCQRRGFGALRPPWIHKGE